MLTQDSVEKLRDILARRRKAAVSMEEAWQVATRLLTYFETMQEIARVDLTDRNASATMVDELASQTSR